LKRSWLVLALCWWLAAGGAWAQAPPAPSSSPPVPAEHVVMLDVSGSMGKGGYGDLRGFSQEVRGMLAGLLAGDGALFRPEDPLVLWPFADPDTEAREGRVPLEGLTLGGLPAALDTFPGPGSGATDLRRALERAMARPTRAAVRFYWVLTDNENNFQGQRSDEPFYLLLRDSPELQHVYFLPLAAPQSASGQVARAGERAGALVLYLAVATRQEDVRWLEPLVLEVEKRLTASKGFPIQAVLFRPLYVRRDQALLDVGRRVEAAPGSADLPGRERWAEASRDSQRYLVPLRPLGSGGALEGRLRFTFLSRLDGWRIEKARLGVPRLRVAGSQARPEARLDRRTLSVEPRKESADSYVLTFRVPGSRSGQASALDADVEMAATVQVGSLQAPGGLQPAVDARTRSRMLQVRELPRILELMLHQGGDAGSDVRSLAVRLPVRLVAEPASGAWGWAAALGALLLVLAGGWWAAGRRYRLEGPDGEEPFRLGGVYRRYRLLSGRGEELGFLAPTPRGLRVLPADEVLVDGVASPQDLGSDGAEFVMQLPGGPTTRFRVEAETGAGPGASREEGPAL